MFGTAVNIKNWCCNIMMCASPTPDITDTDSGSHWVFQNKHVIPYVNLRPITSLMSPVPKNWHKG